MVASMTLPTATPQQIRTMLLMRDEIALHLDYAGRRLQVRPWAGAHIPNHPE